MASMLALAGFTAPVSAAAPASPEASSATSVTLPTGDRVDVLPGGNGFPRFALSPATRPDGSTPVFTTIELRGTSAYVLPSDVGAAPLGRFLVAGSAIAPTVVPADTVPLTVTFTDPAGQPVASGSAEIVDLTGGADQNLVYRIPISNGTGTVQVAAGDTYAALAFLSSNTLDTRRRDLLASTEVTATGPSQLTLAASADVPLLVRPPQPADRLEHFAELMLDGAGVRTGIAVGVNAEGLGAQAGYDLYVTPQPAFATGSLSLQEEWFLGDPALSMATVGARPIELHPVYKPFAVRGALAGDRTVPLVLAGSAAEQGALVLVPISIPAGVNPVSYALTAAGQAASAAATAGALGTVPYVAQRGALPLAGLGVQPVPQLSVSAAEGAALAAQLATEPVTVHLHGTLDPTYLDDLFYQQSGTLVSQHTVDPGRLVRVPTQYHASTPETYLQSWFAFGPNSTAVQNPYLEFHAPAGILEYVGPADGSVLWSRWTTALNGGKQFAMKAYSTYQPGQHDEPVAEQWFDGPIVEGAPEPAALDNPAGIACGLCRGGPNGDTLIPAWFLQDSNPGHYVQSWPDFASNIQLVSGTAQVPPDPNDGSTPFPTFPLSARPATYTLTVDGPTPVNPSSLGIPQHTTTSWTFQTARTTAGTPSTTACPTGLGPVCAYLPLIELHYQLNLDLSDQAPAGAPCTFQLVAAEHSGAVGGGPVAALRVQASSDNGTTWFPVPALAMGGGRYQVTVNAPASANPAGFVSLRVSATDAAGNSVTQTVNDAYGLAGS